MIRFVCTLLWTLVVSLLLAGASIASAETLRIAVASNFSTVLEQLSSGFTATTGHHLRISAGSTGAHFAQLANGAPFDVFVAADQQHPALLVQQGLGLADSLEIYAQGTILLWSSDATLVDSQGKVLRAGNFAHLAIANPQQAPYGQAAQEVLEHLDLWNRLQGKLVQGENITQTYQFVHTGNAELGFIAASQWLENSASGSVWEVPQQLYTPLLQAAVIVKESAAARSFMAYLVSNTAQEIIAAAGYRIPDAQ